LEETPDVGDLHKVSPTGRSEVIGIELYSTFCDYTDLNPDPMAFFLDAGGYRPAHSVAIDLNPMKIVWP
jgi:hypothetical protein